MEIVGLDGGAGLVEVDAAVRLVLDGLRLHAAQHGGATALIAIVVRRLAAEVFITAATVAHDRQQVGLGAGGGEQRRFKTQPLGGVGLQAVDGRVVAVNVISHFRAGHGIAHFRGGAGNSVAAEINHDDRGSGLSGYCILQQEPWAALVIRD